LGFVAPPPFFYGVLAAMVLAYLCVVELTKRAFYAWWRQRAALRA
jgi:hypothetical protein